jgi:hypothetical protein
VRSLVIVTMLVVALPAMADETRHAIVVPTQLGGFIPNKAEVQAGIDVLIANRLRRAKVDVMENPPWLQEELTCHEDICLAQIANRHGVEVVVSSSLVNDEQRNNAYHITVRMFVKGESPSVRERNVTCDYCSEDKATDLLATTVAQAYANEPAPAAASAAPPATAVTATAPPPIDNAPTRTQKLLRGGAIVLGVGGVVALGLGGWKAAQNGDVSCDPVCRQRDTTPGMAAAFAVGAVALVAAVPMAIFGWRHAHARKVAVAGGN